MTKIKRPVGGPPSMDQLALVHRVMSFMLWPDDKSKRASSVPSISEVRLAIHARKYHSKKHLKPGRTSKPPTEPALLDGLKEAWFPELMQEDAQPPSAYISVAVFLYFLIGLQQARSHGVKVEVSDGKAAALTGYHVATRVNGTKLILKSSKQITRVWSKLKRVSHFWLAYLLMAGTIKRDDPVLDHFDDFLDLSNQLKISIRKAYGDKINFKTVGTASKKRRSLRLSLRAETVDLLTCAP